MHTYIKNITKPFQLLTVIFLSTQLSAGVTELQVLGIAECQLFGGTEHQRAGISA